ncbi:MAG TPA: tetratricopeptide repeat protein, partial [Xanthobacteraceae bacterium]
MKPDDAAMAALLGRAMALHRGGQLAAAEELYKSLLAVKTDHFEALHFLGLLEAQRGRYEQAEPLVRRSLEINSQTAEGFANHARVLNALKRSREALAACDRALALNPRSVEALASRGNAWKDLGEYEQALVSYERALAVHPDYSVALANRGNILLLLCRFAESVASFDRLLARNPNEADALFNRARALLGLQQYEEAVASYDRALALRPGEAVAFAERGTALLALGRWQEALANFDRALATGLRDAPTLNNRGAALKNLQREEEALASYDQALAIDPRFADALYNRAGLLKEMKRFDEALAAYDKARATAPDHGGALEVLPAAQAACDFHRIAELQGEVEGPMKAGRAFAPLPVLALCDDPALHLAFAKVYAGEAPHLARLPQSGTLSAEKLRIAYVSGDFCQHPVALLAVELFEIHDRSRFDVIGISFAPDDGSGTRRRLIDGFDAFHDVRTRKDVEIAELIRNCGAHIAVDLTGYTRHSRSRLLSFRPAPIAVNYLGYPGTMGADFIDYVLADPIVLPFDQQPFYCEQIVHLPDCYQVNDRKRPMPELSEPKPSARRAAGLPEHGFVFCCFNNSHKITQPIFELWMRLLTNVPGSVLWLLGDNAAAERNLRRDAQERGIDPARLVFAGRL